MKHIVYDDADSFDFNYAPLFAVPRDLFNGTAGADEIYGLNNKNDTINAGEGADTIGDKSNDASDDVFNGQEGSDTIRSYSGNDELNGGQGDDHMQLRAGLNANGVGFTYYVNGSTGDDDLKISNSEDGHWREDLANGDKIYHIDSDGNGTFDTTVNAHGVETIYWD